MANKRRRVKQTISLNDRLKLFSNQVKQQAFKLRPGRERDELLKRARVADTAARIDEWANSSGLQPPR